MLTFFRKYQRIFFIVITTVIIASFSFFGSYQGMGSMQSQDEIAFTAIDGKPVMLSHLTGMIRFLNLNDEFVRNDFLESGLALSFHPWLAADLKPRFDREKRYAPYVHPQASFLGADRVWSHFAPNIKHHLEALKDIGDPLSEEAFNHRVKLYLAQSIFPQHALKQVLAYQEQQYDKLRPDPYLERRDLSLFGYHTLEEWFGPRFLGLVSEFIINTACYAQEEGYEVTKKEAWASLQEIDCNFQMMGLTREEAIAIWQEVLLFRRLFYDVGNSAFVDAFAFDKIASYANSTVEIEVVSSPIAASDEEAFEIYCDSIALEKEILPTSIKPLKEIAPRLLYREFVIDLKHVEKSPLRQAIPIKTMWEWQLTHWEELTSTFPILAAAHATSRDEQFAALQNLDRTTRAKVDHMAQNELMEEIDLTHESATRETIRLALRGGNTPPHLCDLLTKDHFTYDDDASLYEITVIEKSEPELLTFAKAKEMGVLNALVSLYKRETPDFAVQHHYHNYLERVRRNEAPDVLAQLAPLRTTKECLRGEKPEPFQMEVGESSPIANASFFTVVDRKIGKREGPLPCQELAYEAQEKLTQKLLHLMRSKESFSLAWLGEQE